MIASQRSRTWMLAGKGLVLAGALLAVLALSLLSRGEWLLERIRGRAIQDAEHRRILTATFRLLAMLALGNAMLLVSGGLLVLREPWVESRSPLVGDPGAGAARGWPLRVLVLSGGLWLAAMFAGPCGRSFVWDETAAMVLDVEAPIVRAFEARSLINHIAGGLSARVGLALGVENERGARLVSVAVSAVGLVWTAVWLLEQTGSRLAGFFGFSALAIHGFVLSSASQFRGYALYLWAGVAVVASILTTLESSRARSREAAGSRLLVLCMASASALSLCHFFGFLYLGLVVVLLHVICWDRKSRLGLPAASAASLKLAALLPVPLLVGLALWSPGLPIVVTAKDPKLSLGSSLEAIGLLLTGEPCSVLASVAAVSVSVAVWLLGWSRGGELRVLVILSAVPIAGFLAGALLLRPAFAEGRFLALALPLTVVCFARVLLEPLPSRGRGGLFVGRALAVLAVAGLVPGLVRFAGESAGYRESVAPLRRMLEPGRGGVPAARLVLLGRPSDHVLRYYLRGAPVLDGRDPSTWESWREESAGPELLVAIVGWPEAMSRQGVVPEDVVARLKPVAVPSPGERQSPVSAWITRR